MGIYDRDYYRESTRSWWGWGDRRVTFWLIGIMVGAFVVHLFTRLPQQPWESELSIWTQYNYAAILGGQVWRLLTAHFVPSDSLIGLVFTLYFLYLVGSELEVLYGPAEFLAFYLTTALVISLSRFALGLAGLVPPDANYLGISGPVTAGFILYACHYPYRRILLFFILPVPAWLLAVGAVLFTLAGLTTAGQTGFAFAAPLVGFAFAFAYYRLNLRILSWLPQLGRVRMPRRKPALRVYEESREPRQPVAAFVAKSKPEESARGVDEQLEAKLDQVLEKVARYGRESLTADEQQILQRASEIYKRRRGN
jgi:membrane associated rhomboid family serine protease